MCGGLKGLRRLGRSVMADTIGRRRREDWPFLQRGGRPSVFRISAAHGKEKKECICVYVCIDVCICNSKDI
jgi:hypothetical protein